MTMNKPDWDEERLQRLIHDQVQESVTLEYKSSKALTKGERDVKELSKDVSAFANSAGGTIVYGIVEKGHTPERLDEGVDPATITREWIEQVLNSNIQRRIDGIRITQVPLTITSPGRVAYVVEVPQSLRAPHQANDKRFYKRFNFQSVAMEEYEIRDVARRQESPDLRVVFSPDWGDQSRDLTRWHVVLQNRSPVPCREAVIDLMVDSNLKLADWRPLNLTSQTHVSRGDRTLALMSFRLFWTAKLGVPCFEGCPVQVSDVPVVVDHSKLLDGGVYPVKWRVSAPRSAPKEAWAAYWIKKIENGMSFGFEDETQDEDEVLSRDGIRWFEKGEIISTGW